MAHCGSCKSKLGTGFLPKASKRFGSGAAPMTSIALTESGGMQSSSMTKALRTVWIAAVPSEAAGPIGDLWAVYTGGKRARLHVAGKSQVRRVLEIRNGGVTGVEVRLGVPVLAFGTGGCQRPKPGTGAIGWLPDGWLPATFLDKPPGHGTRRWYQLVSQNDDGTYKAVFYRRGRAVLKVPAVQIAGSGASLKAKVGIPGLPGHGSAPTPGTGADRPTHTSWPSSKNTVGPYSGGHQGQIDIASVDYGAQGEGAAVGYYALGTAGARNEELALAASSGPRHLRRR